VNVVVLTGRLQEYEDIRAAGAIGLRTNAYVTEAAAQNGTLDRARVIPLSIVPITAGEYVDAMADLGSPLGPFTWADFGGSDDLRLRADGALVTDFSISLQPEDSTCSGSASVDTRALTPGRYRVSAEGSGAVDVRVGLFARPVDGTSLGTLAPGNSAIVRIPALPAGFSTARDPSELRWFILAAPGLKVSRC
jgi:hypothetical protein